MEDEEKGELQWRSERLTCLTFILDGVNGEMDRIVPSREE